MPEPVHFPADSHTFMGMGRGSAPAQASCFDAIYMIEAVICSLAQAKLVLFHIILHIQENSPQ